MYWCAMQKKHQSRYFKRSHPNALAVLRFLRDDLFVFVYFLCFGFGGVHTLTLDVCIKMLGPWPQGKTSNIWDGSWMALLTGFLREGRPSGTGDVGVPT